MQYHESLITADGAYHCPVGSIMAIFGLGPVQSSGEQVQLQGGVVGRLAGHLLRPLRVRPAASQVQGLPGL